MHPLKTLSLMSWLVLFLLQLALFWPSLGFNYYLASLLSLLLLIPLKGLFDERLYTYKWVGFLMLFYFCIGVSELIANPQLQFYGGGTTLASLTLFLASIYYTRYLRTRCVS